MVHLMRSLTLATALLFAEPLLAAGLPIKKTFLSGPTRLCHLVHCVLIEPGLAHYYESASMNNPLESGFLAEDTELGGIRAVKGMFIRFTDPTGNTFEDFSLTSDNPQTWGGVKFVASVPVQFDRFHFGDGDNRPGTVPYPNGVVHLTSHGNEATEIEGMSVDRGEIALAAKVAGDGLTDLQLERGRLSRPFILNAAHPIEMLEGDLIAISSDQVQITPYKHRTFGPRAITGTSATIDRKSGGLLRISLEGTLALKSGARMRDDLVFHKNGNVRFGKLSSAPHTVSNIAVKASFENSYILFYEDETPQTFATSLVDANAAFLPDALAKILPSVIPGHKDRLQFFFGPKGEYRAVVLKGRWDLALQDMAFVVTQEGDHLAFALLPPETNLSRDLVSLTQSKCVEEYLVTGKICKGK